MILRYPAYYEKFECIAGDCEDTCCAGWEIDIDDESYQYYMSVEGEFGERLRASIKEYEADDEDVYESHGFILKEKKRCPFLNENNLCDMYIALGEDSLCDVCTNTPRNILEYGGERELAISASCAEAGRLIYTKKDRTTFVEKEIPEELDFEESEEEIAFAKIIRAARDNSILILQNRMLSIYERICHFLNYAEKVQECLNENKEEKISQIDLADFMKSTEKCISTKVVKKYEWFLKRMVSFTGMESISEEWEDMLRGLQKRYVENPDGADTYEKDSTAFQIYMREQDREYEYEHLMVYYAFMCLARCVDDWDFAGKAKLCVVSFLMIRDMDRMWFGTHENVYRREDRIRMARIYAKEVEHSEENLDYLADEFLFENTFATDVLRECI